MRKQFLLAGALLAAISVYAQSEKLDLPTIDSIRQEGLRRSKVMDIAFHLTDASGDRLTAFVYNTAQRDEKLPRKALPEPRGAGRF